jgi:hypothetical protein
MPRLAMGPSTQNMPSRPQITSILSLLERIALWALRVRSRYFLTQPPPFFAHAIVFFSTGLGDGVGETVGLGVAVGVGVR